jgi:hypothetical protein
MTMLCEIQRYPITAIRVADSTVEGHGKARCIPAALMGLVAEVRKRLATYALISVQLGFRGCTCDTSLRNARLRVDGHSRTIGTMLPETRYRTTPRSSVRNKKPDNDLVALFGDDRKRYRMASISFEVMPKGDNPYCPL